MRIRLLSCRNIKGFEGDFSLEPKDVTVAAGQNGEGKTSLLSLVVGLFGKASQRMLRRGATSGEIRAVIEDEDTGETIEFVRRFDTDGVKPVTAKDSTKGRLGAPASFLKEIIDDVSVNPIAEALNASEVRQAEILLETMKLDLDWTAVTTALADAIDVVPMLPGVAKKAQKLPALDALSSLREVIYEERTGVNRDAKAKRAHAGQLREAVGESADLQDCAAVEKRLQEELDAVTRRKNDDTILAETALVKVTADLEAGAEQEKGEIDRQIDAQIAELNAERERRKKTLDDGVAESKLKLTTAHQVNLTSIEELHRPERERIVGELAVARASSASQEQDRRSLQIALDAEKEALALEAAADRMTEAIKQLDEVRSGLLEKLPIPGLKVEKGAIYLDGVPLSEVNTQRRAELWLKVGAMRAKDLGIVCADGMECLDDQHFSAFVQAAKKTGLQWFFGRVDSAPFRIETL